MELQKEELNKLYADTFRGLYAGIILKGKVIRVRPDGIIVDIGTKCEGFIPIEEISKEESNRLRDGDEIEVYVMDTKVEDGFLILSRQKVVKIKTWEMLEEACNREETVTGKIIGKVKGGMKVDIDGISAFLPGSHIDIKLLKETDHLIGETCVFRVLKVDSKRSNIILSRRLVLEGLRDKMRKETISQFKEGAIVKGVVKNITDYGVFIDLGGIDGLLHISDMSWGKISHPGELFSIGDNVEVVVRYFDPVTEKVTLGYKQKKPNPWVDAEKKYSPGTKVIGRVTSVVDYGIFVEIESGLEGLIHVSEFDWSEKVKKPSKYFSIGDTVEAVILSLNSDEKKISLSIKRLKPNPWESVKERYTIGKKVTGLIKTITDFGAFINLDEGIDALLHISEMSWTKHIRHPSEVLKKGQKIEVVIQTIDPEKERITVSLKRLNDDPWIEEIPNKYKLGDKMTGKIVKIADAGIFVELADGVEGLIYASEIESLQSKNLDFKVGAELRVRIIKVDTSERKIGLSIEAE